MRKWCALLQDCGVRHKLRTKHMAAALATVGPSEGGECGTAPKFIDIGGSVIAVFA